MADANKPDSTTSSDAPRNEPRRPRGCGGVFLVFMLTVAAAWGAGLGLFLHLLDNAEETLDRANLQSFRPKEGSKVWSDDPSGPRLLHEFAIETRQVVPLNEIPLNLQKAFIASEDRVFYQHKGVRPDAIAKAAVYILRTGRRRGGSTITQQLVRNIDRTGITTEISFSRKLNEALIALQLERQFTKDEILELYLNQIFLGISAYGVEAASEQYFAKSCRDLTLGECALLAGINPSPSRYQPFTNPERALERRDLVLKQMLERGFVARDEYDAAVQESLEDSLVTPEERKELGAKVSREWLSHTSGYFVEEVRRVVGQSSPVTEQAEAEENPVFESGLQIYTTLDTRLQQAAEQVLAKHLDEFDKRKLAYLQRNKREAEFMPASAAMVCLDNRPGYQGFIRAMVGGRDFQRQKFNMATQAKRQPGSGVKPFVWAAAIDLLGYTPSTIVLDAPYVKRFGNTVWAPKNFGGEYYGPVTMRVAIQKSLNTVSVRLAEKVGVAELRKYMENMGVTSPIDPMAGLTLALGSSAVTVLDQAVAYSTLVNGGRRFEPVYIKEIRDRDGLTLFHAEPHAEQAIRPEVAYVVTHLMEGVAQFGTGAGTAPLKRPRAGKTGTTNDSKDAWFCGFTPDFTCIVWIGYEDNSPLGIGRSYTGGQLAVPIWTDFMIEAHKGIEPREFDVPPGIDLIGVDRRSGSKGGSFQEAFIKGTQPPSYAPAPQTSPTPESSPAPAPAAPTQAPADSLGDDLLPAL